MLAILLIAGPLLAHSEPYVPPEPQPPPPPPVLKKPVQIFPLRWSWVHWWEANRERYLQAPNQSRDVQSLGREELDRLRIEASTVLIKEMESTDKVARLAAALALGRIGGPPAEGTVRQLKKNAELDPSEEVRLRCLLAIGMIGDDECERVLSEYKAATHHLLAGSIIATGFLDKPSDELLDRLWVLTGDSSPTIRASALWALAQHRQALDEPRLLAKIRADASPWIVADAEQAIGLVAEELGTDALCAIVVGDENIENWSAWHLLKQVRIQKSRMVQIGNTFQVPLKVWMEAHLRLHAQNPLPVGDLSEHERAARPRPLDADRAPGDMDIKDDTRSARIRQVSGIEEIYHERLRSSAAIGLGKVGDQPGVVQALQTLINIERDDYRDYHIQPKCFALISLGQIGAKEGLPTLLDVLDSQASGRIKPQKDLESPMRGFAAIGLGLYARPYESAQGTSNRPRYDAALEMLGQRLLDKRENLEVRCACAMALGISGRTATLKVLISQYETLDEVNPMLGGYVLLSRALLGDQSLLTDARKALLRKPHRDELTMLLARRAAVLAMGVTGSGEAIPNLVRFYDEPHYVNRDIILALSLCSTEGVTTHVLPVLRESDNPYERAYMSEVVGRLLAQEKPPPLSRFLIDSNFTMKNGLFEPYKRISNPFMYEYLIPQFGEIWY